jgi:hypothetical protein
MLPRHFKFICLTRGKLPSCYLWMYTSTTISTSLYAATTRLRPHVLYVNLAVRREYSSLGRTCSTSTSPCAASTRHPAARDLPRLRRASGCLGSSRGPSRGSSLTTPLRVRVPRHVARIVTRLVAPLVVDYSTARPGASARRATRHATRRATLVDYSASPRLVVDYFASTTRPGASARRAARHAARRAARLRLLRLAQARRRLLHRASGCLGTSRGSSRG